MTVGVVATRNLEHREDATKGPPSVRPMFMKRIGSRLDLTPAQRAAVENNLVEKSS